MQISITKLLGKMEKELNAAKSELNQMKLKEHLIAIRTLCDLIIEEGPGEEANEIRKSNRFQQSITMASPIQKVESDEANGESLFDF